MLGLIRTVYAIAATLVVVGGYVASQWAYFHGNAAEYAKSVDSTPIVAVSAVLVVAAIVLAFLPEKEGDQ